MVKKNFHPYKRLQSFRYAFRGLRYGFHNQVNIWIHLLMAILVALCGFYFSITNGEWIAILLCIGCVISAELFNTALEYLVDLVSPDYHPLAGKVKDIAAGAVLIISIIAAAVGLLIFIPRILEMGLV